MDALAHSVLEGFFVLSPYLFDKRETLNLEFIYTVIDIVPIGFYFKNHEGHSCRL